MENTKLKSYISLMFVVCFTFVIALFTAGCDHEHSSSNLELVQEQEATCSTDGHKAYYKCKDCDKIFEDENGETETTLEDVVVKAHHTLEHHPAKAATCMAEGNKEYWQCTGECGKKFTNSNGTVEFSGSVVTEKKSEHALTNVLEVPAKCTTAGVKQHWECEDCHDKFFKNDNDDYVEITNENALVINAKGHTFGDLIKKDATCTEEGTKAHYKCSVCQKNYADNEGKVEIENTVLPKLQHTYGNEIAEVKATCVKAGTKAHYECEKCGANGVKGEGSDVITEVTAESLVLAIDPTAHDYNHVGVTTSTCITHGIKEHYTCNHEGCDKLFTKTGDDEDATYEVVENADSLKLELAAHTWGTEPVAKEEPTCTEDGHEAYYECSVCHAKAVKDGEIYTIKEDKDLVLGALGHKFGNWVDEQPATCEKNGTKGYKTCSRCNKNFDVTEQLIDDLTIPATGHKYVEVPKKDATCTEDGYKAHFKCNNEGCNKLFIRTDEGERVVYEEIKESDLVIKAGHTMVDGICSVCHYGAVAVVNGTYYKTLTDAINAAESGATITLTNNITINSYISINKSLTINFGGYTITSKNTVDLNTIDFNKTEASEDGTGKINGHGFDIGETTGEGVTVIFKNGKLITDKWGGWVENKATFNVEKGFSIYSSTLDEKLDNANAVTVEKGATLNLYGKAETRYGPTISGNGTQNYGDVVINIYDDAEVTSGNDVAIYMPNTKELNIKGGTITGTTAVYVKYGTTNISGGTLIATGDKKDYAINGNGGDATGAALVIDVCCNYPGGDPIVVIGDKCTFQVKTGDNVESADLISYYHNKDDATHEATITNNSTYQVVEYEYDATTAKATKVTTSESGNEENTTQGGTTEGEDQGGNQSEANA